MDLIITPETDPDPFWDMLLLTAPDKRTVEQSLETGKLYVAEWDDVVLGTFILIELDAGLWELKHSAVAQEWQRKGVGKALIVKAIETARDLGAKRLETGASNSSFAALAFFQKAGFRIARIAKNYFTLNYDEPMFENGIECRDLVILAMEL